MAWRGRPRSRRCVSRMSGSGLSARHVAVARENNAASRMLLASIGMREEPAH